MGDHVARTAFFEADLTLPQSRTAVAVRAGTLTNLQVLRAAAAVAVLLCHASVYTGRQDGDLSLQGVFGAPFGLMGVMVFFAISGFLMARLVRSTDPWTFLAHRVLRIFPAYLGLAVLFSLLAPALGIGVGLKLISVTLAPAGQRAYPLGIEWTLLFETTFYVGLVVLALTGLARWLEAVALVWLAVLLAVWLAVPELASNLITPPVHLILFSAANVPFAGGLLLPWLIRKRWMPPALLILAVPLVLVCTAFTLDTGRWLGGIAAVIIVGWAVQVRQIQVRGWLSRTLVALGDWSYVIYLVHVPVILSVLAFTPRSWNTLLVWSLTVAAALAVAALIGPVEVGLYRRLRAWANAASGRSLRVFGLAYLAIFCTAAATGSVQSGIEIARDTRMQGEFAAIPAAALRGTTALAPAIPGIVRGAVERVEVTPDGQALLSAWALAEAEPKAELYLGAYCDGRLIGSRRVSRQRPEIIKALGPAAIGAKRIGFTLQIGFGLCGTGGQIRAIVMDEAGRMAALPEMVVMPGGQRAQP